MKGCANQKIDAKQPDQDSKENRKTEVPMHRDPIDTRGERIALDPYFGTGKRSTRIEQAAQLAVTDNRVVRPLSPVRWIPNLPPMSTGPKTRGPERPFL